MDFGAQNVRKQAATMIWQPGECAHFAQMTLSHFGFRNPS
jgi:hypothetical protein